MCIGKAMEGDDARASLTDINAAYVHLDKQYWLAIWFSMY